jgi:hypothetical protein|tara:strand:+ start:1000 stop:1665 length:666 start_codon:yes stop_codon:yes gene_type:complete
MKMDLSNSQALDAQLERVAQVESSTITFQIKASGSDKYQHGYQSMYHKIFTFYHPKHIMEFGIKMGHSHECWLNLFPEAMVYGLDIAKDPMFHSDSEHLNSSKARLLFDKRSDERLHYRTSLQQLGIDDEDPNFQFDVIIDDGDHNVGAQIGSFIIWRNKFKHVYVIEDILSEEYLWAIRRVVHGLGYITHVEKSSKIRDDSQYILAIARKDSEFGNAYCK